MPPTSSPLVPASSRADRRSARLEARLAVYAQYASLVADEVAAAWSDRPEQASQLPRALAEARAGLAEQYEALRDAGVETAFAGEFDAALSEAVTEHDHRTAIDRALHDRLVTMRTAGRLTSGDDTATPAPESDDAPYDDAPPFSDRLGGALVDVRARGVGGLLGGQFPGVVAGTAPPLVGADDDATAGHERPARLDLTF